VRVAFLGPEGTWSHEALLRAAPPEAHHVPYRTIRSAIIAVRDRAVDRALVPIDNALEGSVGPTLDTLLFEAPGVTAVGEVVQPVSHALVAAGDVPLSSITSVHSHPQASAQSARFLAEELPGATIVTATSTAAAIQALAAAPAGTAALGSRAAAERYDAVVLRDAVEDVPGNSTRFLWLTSAPTGSAAPGSAPVRGGSEASAHRTILAWWGDAAGTPGWLVACLGCFATRSINLTRIESRPHKEIRGEYVFLIDLDGAIGTPAVDEAVDELRRRADVVRVIGSYPVVNTARG
jgi:prephenate dehydratase